MVSPASEDSAVDRHGQSGWRSVAWEGEIDVAVAPAMLARTLEGAHDTSRVVADLEAVQFMDAAGLRALIRARSLLRARGGDFLVRNPPPKVYWLLAHFDLTDLIEPATQTATPGSTSQAGRKESTADMEPPSAHALDARPSHLHLLDGPVDLRPRTALGRTSDMAEALPPEPPEPTPNTRRSWDDDKRHEHPVE